MNRSPDVCALRPHTHAHPPRSHTVHMPGVISSRTLATPHTAGILPSAKPHKLQRFADTLLPGVVTARIREIRRRKTHDELARRQSSARGAAPGGAKSHFRSVRALNYAQFGEALSRLTAFEAQPDCWPPHEVAALLFLARLGGGCN